MRHCGELGAPLASGRIQPAPPLYWFESALLRYLGAIYLGALQTTMLSRPCCRSLTLQPIVPFTPPLHRKTSVHVVIGGEFTGSPAATDPSGASQAWEGRPSTTTLRLCFFAIVFLGQLSATHWPGCLRLYLRDYAVQATRIPCRQVHGSLFQPGKPYSHHCAPLSAVLGPCNFE